MLMPTHHIINIYCILWKVKSLHMYSTVEIQIIYLQAYFCYEYISPMLQAGIRIHKTALEYTLEPDLFTPVDSCSYLGVIISSDFWWSTHIDSICAKATRTLNFIRRNNPNPIQSKSFDYTALARPHLVFAACACDQ